FLDSWPLMLTIVIGLVIVNYMGLSKTIPDGDYVLGISFSIVMSSFVIILFGQGLVEYNYTYTLSNKGLKRKKVGGLPNCFYAGSSGGQVIMSICTIMLLGASILAGPLALFGAGGMAWMQYSMMKSASSKKDDEEEEEHIQTFIDIVPHHQFVEAEYFLKRKVIILYHQEDDLSVYSRDEDGVRYEVVGRGQRLNAIALFFDTEQQLLEMKNEMEKIFKITISEAIKTNKDMFYLTGAPEHLLDTPVIGGSYKKSEIIELKEKGAKPPEAMTIKEVRLRNQALLEMD
ncbi:hypothetical protein N9R79_12355, partial [Vibrio sp.]|nr:hypothetical protein [Vibrio sp.]